MRYIILVLLLSGCAPLACIDNPNDAPVSLEPNYHWAYRDNSGYDHYLIQDREVGRCAIHVIRTREVTKEEYELH